MSIPSPDNVLIARVQLALRHVESREEVRKMHAVTAYRAMATDVTLGDAIAWVEDRMEHFRQKPRPKEISAPISDPTVTLTPRLLISLRDFVDVIIARGWISASYCEGCHQSAPAEATRDGHGLAKLGKVTHTAECPLARATQLLLELGG